MMPTTVLEGAPSFCVRDAVALPRDHECAVVGRASRTDTYPILVTQSTAQTLVTLSELLGAARVALIADQAVLELPTGPIDGEAVIAAMDKVRLIRAGSLRYVLPRRLGETLIADDVTDLELRHALRESGVPCTR